MNNICDFNGVVDYPYEKISFKKVNNRNLELAICYPKTIKPVGCVIFIHGGGWKSDDTYRLLPHAKYTALNGGIGVSISYRLLGENENIDVRDGLSDCIDAVKYVRKKVFETYGNLKITVAGDSAGGYYANCLGCGKILRRMGENNRLVDFVVDFNGITDLTGKWHYGIIKKDSDISSEKEIEKDFSPVYNIGQGDAGLLIVHGDKDKTVDIEDALKYFREAKSIGVESDFILLENAMHAFILFDYHHDNVYVEGVLKSIIKYLKNKRLI